MIPTNVVDGFCTFLGINLYMIFQKSAQVLYISTLSDTLCHRIAMLNEVWVKQKKSCFNEANTMLDKEVVKTYLFCQGLRDKLVFSTYIS